MQSNIKISRLFENFVYIIKVSRKADIQKKIQKSKVPNEIFGFMIREPLELGVPES